MGIVSAIESLKKWIDSFIDKSDMFTKQLNEKVSNLNARLDEMAAEAAAKRELEKSQSKSSLKNKKANVVSRSKAKQQKDDTKPKEDSSIVKSILVTDIDTLIKKGISESDFSNKKSMTTVIIPNGVTKIKSYAFMGCTSLKSVVVPKSVTEIGSCAFEKCI